MPSTWASLYDRYLRRMTYAIGKTTLLRTPCPARSTATVPRQHSSTYSASPSAHGFHIARDPSFMTTPYFGEPPVPTLKTPTGCSRSCRSIRCTTRLLGQ